MGDDKTKGGTGADNSAKPDATDKSANKSTPLSAGAAPPDGALAAGVDPAGDGAGGAGVDAAQDEPALDARETWGGFLKELEGVAGAEVHAIHARLQEITQFFEGALESTEGMTHDALVHLRNLIHGTLRP